MIEERVLPGYPGDPGEVLNMGDPRIMNIAPVAQQNLGQVIGAGAAPYNVQGPQPAVIPSNGSYYHPLNMREAYEQRGIPPVPYTRGGYAPLAFRTFVDPWGQMTVQPLVGGITKYPHVLSGVPANPMMGFGFASQLGPLTWPIMYPPNAPFMQQPQASAPAPRQRAAASTTGLTTATKKVDVQPAAPQGQHWVHPEGNPMNNVGHYELVPDDFSQAALHPQYEGQLRANANWVGPGAISLQPQVQPAASAAPTQASPWYAPAIDDLARMGIRFPQMTYQPQLSEPAPVAPAPAPVAPAPAPVAQPPLPYDDGPFVGGYNPYAPAPAPLPTALQPAHAPIQQAPRLMRGSR